MRFLEIAACPGHYMYWHYRMHPKLGQEPYARQKAEFMADGVNGGMYLGTAMQALGYEAWTVIANNLHLQQKWCDDYQYGMPADQTELVVEQINRFAPDILYIHDCLTYGSTFIRSLGKRPRLVLGYHAAPVPEDTDWSAFDMLLTPWKTCREAALACGAQSVEYAFPGFDDNQVLPPGVIEPALDVSFTGSWSPLHGWRNALLAKLAGVAAKEDAPFTPVYCLNSLGKSEVPELVGRFDRGAVWGRRMYGLLAGSRMALNAAMDCAEREAPNMRLMEATGMGALLLTEKHPSLEAFFRPHEVAAFATPDELVERIIYYKNNEQERADIAARGQARCLRDFSLAVRARAMDRRIERVLRPQAFDAAGREELIRKATEMVAAGEQGLLQAAGEGVQTDLTTALWQAFCRGDSAEVETLAPLRAKLLADSYEHYFCRCLYHAVRGEMSMALEFLQQELDAFPENDRARQIYAELLCAYPG